MEAGIGAKRLAWAVIAVLACGFCYCIGFQSGSADATTRFDQRIHEVTATLQTVIRQHSDLDDASASSGRAPDATAAAW